MTPPLLHPRRAFTLVESVISMLIMSVVITGALGGIGVAARHRRLGLDRMRAVGYADELMRQILALPYQDPATAPTTEPVIGLDAGEIVGQANTFDDADDYHGYIENPMLDETNKEIPGNWYREVTVVWVTPLSNTTISGTGTGVKRIVVSVYKDGMRLSRLKSRLSRAGESLSRPLNP